jgi:hypothetical protein
MNWYTNHGTKILGVIITILGGFLLLPIEQQTALVGETAPRVAVGITGLLTILRGFQNSGSIPGGPKS